MFCFFGKILLIIKNFLFSIYWPYKLWQRQEKDRQQQQIQNLVKQSKLSSYSSLPLLPIDNGEKCERATSPLRILTPAKRLLPTPPTNNTFIPVETTIIERPPTRNTHDRPSPTRNTNDRSSPTRNTNDRPIPTVVSGQNQSPPLTGLINIYIFFYLINYFIFL